MTQQQWQEAEALHLMVKAINCLLMAQNRPYRVTAKDIVMSRRDGFTFLAIPETRDAADWRTCAQPYSTTENGR